MMIISCVVLVVVWSSTVVSEPAWWSISNSYYQVNVSVGSDNDLTITGLNVNRSVAGMEGWTKNLLWVNSGFPSGTAILNAKHNSTWSRSTLMAQPVVTSTTLKFPNVSVEGCHESWTISLQGNELTFSVSRTFTEDISVVADQSPVLYFDTSVAIPGFVDPDVFLDNRTSAGFLLDADAYFYELLTPNLDQSIRLAPYNLRFDSSMSISSGGFMTFGKLSWDGTSAFVAVGVETVDRRNGPRTYKQGDKVSVTWSLSVIPDLGFPYGDKYGPEDLTLSIPRDGEVEKLSKMLVTVHNNFLGFIFGNNPASVICLHEMGFFPMMQGILSYNPAATQAIKKELEFLLTQGVNGTTGYVMPRWASGGFYFVQWGPLHDQIPHAILAVYYHVLRTGDKTWLAGILPRVEFVAKYLISLDSDGDGVPEIPLASGLPDGGKHTSNWYDIIEFGHKDAIIAAYSCMALQALADMTEWVGNSTASAYYAKLHAKWVGGFNTLFWNDNTGIYMDWIDVKGGKHSYFYVDQNLLAIIFGIANKTQAQSIINKLDTAYDNLSTKFKVPRESIWATPCNMIPITLLGDMVFNGSLQNQKDYPNYENGGSFFHSIGFEVAARAIAGDPDGAYEVYKNSLTTGLNVGPGFMWSALLKWDTQTTFGEPLTSAMFSTWGLIRGCFGVWPTLTNGLVHTGAYSTMLEGASTTFQFLGINATLTVNGTVNIRYD